MLNGSRHEVRRKIDHVDKRSRERPGCRYRLRMPVGSTSGLDINTISLTTVVVPAEESKILEKSSRLESLMVEQLA